MTALALAIIIALLALTQPSRERAIVGGVYAIINLSHISLISPWADGYVYYLSAAAFDVGIMWLIIRMNHIPAIGVSIMRLCIAELIVNLAGWILWWNYYEPAVYNVTYQCMQVWAVLILTRKDTADDMGGYQVDRRSDWIRLIIGQGHRPV